MPAITATEYRPPTFTCTTCGRSNPYLEAHVCQLSERQQRRFAEWTRTQRSLVTAAPADCRDCGRPMPGVGEGAHACSGPPASPSMPGPIDQLAAHLRLAGYKIETDR